MSVTRYRDVSEMPPLGRSDPSQPMTYARIKELWRFSSRLAPRLFRPGVYRFHSIDEAGAAREQATIERMRRLREKRER